MAWRLNSRTPWILLFALPFTYTCGPRAKKPRASLTDKATPSDSTNSDGNVDDGGAKQQVALGLLKLNCEQCHGGGDGKNQGGIDYILDIDRLVAEGMLVRGNAEASRVYTSIKSEKMPKGKKFEGDIQIVFTWIQSMDGNGVRPPPPPPPPPVLVEILREGFALLTPEEFAASLKVAFSYSFKVTPEVNRALGGADYDMVFERDRVPQTQTGLMIRRMAAAVAFDIVKIDLAAQEASRPAKVFGKSSLLKDRPYADDPAAGSDELLQQKRWLDQLDDLYLRAYSRPPSAPEIAAIRISFLTTFTASNSVAEAWRAVLFAILSTAEFWNA